LTLSQSGPCFPPDIDVDFCEGAAAKFSKCSPKIRRASRCPDHHVRKLKQERVRDVGRVMGLSYAAATGSADDSKRVNITTRFGAEKKLGIETRESRPTETKQPVRIREDARGLSRNCGVHAAGVVIAIAICPITSRSAATSKARRDQASIDGPAERSRACARWIFSG